MKISRVGLVAVLTFLGSALILRADDGLKRYQQALRAQGFYYGPVDGSPGDETTQAIRRYQIRNGLAVTGNLDDDTRHSIDRNGEDAQSTPPPLATPPPAARPTPPLYQATPTPRAAVHPDGADDNRNPPAGLPPPARDDNAAPDGRQHVPPSVALTNYFGGTPFEFAPPPVQADTIRRAQFILNRSGFYDGEADGRPSRDLAEAVANFQEVRRLRRSGRLDNDTLAALRLTPGRHDRPPSRATYDDRSGGTVYDGRIVH